MTANLWNAWTVLQHVIASRSPQSLSRPAGRPHLIFQVLLQFKYVHKHLTASLFLSDIKAVGGGVSKGILTICSHLGDHQAFVHPVQPQGSTTLCDNFVWSSLTWRAPLLTQKHRLLQSCSVYRDYCHISTTRYESFDSSLFWHQCNTLIL